MLFDGATGHIGVDHHDATVFDVAEIDTKSRAGHAETADRPVHRIACAFTGTNDAQPPQSANIERQHFLNVADMR
ncbi:hypothetical protein M527_28730 [Sphingobium indicum IP26]|uniref:Uncharacterized protein n=1 Tax=Sphingobium indicum F2 TaxID=1450518 RepID=A0A8E0WP63_9SPHN|nr:hypothetical protein M527_28730 [Sphingobium indicum IP26]EQB07559.1 hypothetical protein L286_03505 [Sphingobium sp. HDIP04]KER34857.1 hypothetical protein AL00_19245 [Sphingobium indicum F2]